MHAYGEKILSPCVWLLATSLILVSPKIPVAITPCLRELRLSSTSSRFDQYKHVVHETYSTAVLIKLHSYRMYSVAAELSSCVIVTHP